MRLRLAFSVLPSTFVFSHSPVDEGQGGSSSRGDRRKFNPFRLCPSTCNSQLVEAAAVASPNLEVSAPHDVGVFLQHKGAVLEGGPEKGGHHLREPSMQLGGTCILLLITSEGGEKNSTGHGAGMRSRLVVLLHGRGAGGRRGQARQAHPHAPTPPSLRCELAG